ncbi:hypothetical protein TanjilG_16917 [Lupinus angustifolius]|uniref:uncharacterized protein LOC109335223 n=1 Tax=Lupinus angustifolius TaxID=3871 RepID=UPI00090E8651|nr:PREDICTED: uncharacterized protein LOC109335223 [Lupinus angustifolius]OIV90957.1 hypothetical protein TanjilG_16917 [Lupinus angustifolius]
MGFRELGFSLFIFLYFINLASSFPIRKTLLSEPMLKDNIEDKGLYGSKIEGGTHGGGSHGNGNGGESSLPNTHGGTGLIPVYAAGAANNNHQHHHGAANCNLDKIKFSTMVMITSTHVLILLYLLI